MVHVGGNEHTMDNMSRHLCQPEPSKNILRERATESTRDQGPKEWAVKVVRKMALSTMTSKDAREPDSVMHAS